MHTIAMAEFKIGVGISDLGAVQAHIAGQMFPRLSGAVNLVAQTARIDWIKSIQHASLWSGEKIPYAASVQISQEPGSLTATVWSDYKYAEDIETGRPARDLKEMLNTSTKVRRTESGKRFLIIPMRQNTPGNDATSPSMPDSVYPMAKGMEPSRITGVSMRPSGQTTRLSPTSGMMAIAGPKYLSNPKTGGDLMVRSRSYQWGDRLSRGALVTAGLSAKQVRRYAGMVKMDGTGLGKGKTSLYMTFRIMMEGSAGWVIPAKPGLYLAKNVADALQPKATMIFAEAIKRDLA